VISIQGNSQVVTSKSGNKRIRTSVRDKSEEFNKNKITKKRRTMRKALIRLIKNSKAQLVDNRPDIVIDEGEFSIQSQLVYNAVDNFTYHW
jgi:hypothetical protein